MGKVRRTPLGGGARGAGIAAGPIELLGITAGIVEVGAVAIPLGLVTFHGRVKGKQGGEGSIAVSGVGSRRLPWGGPIGLHGAPL